LFLEPNNPHLLGHGSNLARAKQLLDQNGSLTEAALFLEAAIQQGELGEGGHEAWILLGEARSMDEREDAAMRALLEGVRRAREAGNNGEGMLVSWKSLIIFWLILMLLLGSHLPSPTRMNLSTARHTQHYISGFLLNFHLLYLRSSRALYQAHHGLPTSRSPTRSWWLHVNSIFKGSWILMSRSGSVFSFTRTRNLTRPRIALEVLWLRVPK
jgi:hypothetical protein